MVRHTFANLQAAVNHARKVGLEGADMASAELETLMRFAKTNFAACNDLVTARNVVSARFKPGDKSAPIIGHVLEWLYGTAREQCRCQAPGYISCDYAVASMDRSPDRCTCDEECPFKQHTGLYD